MRILLKNGTVVNVFTDILEKKNVLIEDGKIIGVGDYDDADIIEDVSGKFICPGFTDCHMHIESTMLTPYELAKAVVAHGTTTIVADPHEIANVCGNDGIKYMLEASKNLPLKVYIMLPSCVPATCFDESGAKLTAEILKTYYYEPRVLGLAEMMNYPGTIAGDKDIVAKIFDALKNNRVVDGHAPLLSGTILDKYLSYGIHSDHECSNFNEASERISKGQWLMIREGTAAKNLEALIDLFDEPYSRRCVLVTDDRHPADLIADGHIDNIIRKAVSMGKSAITGIRMATVQAAQCFGLKYAGAIAPGYRADILVLNDLDTVDVCDVYCNGKKTVTDGIISEICRPEISSHILKSVYNSFNADKVKPSDFYIEPKGNKVRIIKTIKDQLLTDEWITELDFDKNNGIDEKRDILKIALLERHMRTGHKCVGYISGIGLKKGAIASSIAHDSHNITVIGTNDEDIATAVNAVISMGGGCVAVADGKVVSALELPIAGIMTDKSAEEAAIQNAKLRDAVYSLGVPENTAPFMIMAFLSLTVIPNIKLSTQGLIDVNNQKTVDLFVK